MNERFIDELKDLDRKTQVIDHDKYGRYAVTIPLVLKEDGYHVVFETRNQSVIQPGEVCFPGGRKEKGETYFDTAVRETMEELLVDKDQVEIIRSMDYFLAPSFRIVIPYICVLKDYTGSYNKAEVADVFTVPLKWFFENHGNKYMCTMIQQPTDDFPFDKIPGGRDYPWGRGKSPIYFYYYEDRVIWGLTARILHAAVKVLDENGIRP